MKEPIEDIDAGRLKMGKLSINIIYLLVMVFSLGGTWYKFSSMEEDVRKQGEVVERLDKQVTELNSNYKWISEWTKALQSDVRDLLRNRQEGRK